MVENEGFTSDMRAREDEYFRRKDRELIEKMRNASEADQTRQQLEAASGLRDPELLQELEALGFTPQTVPLLPLVPIVQVAWAEGSVTDAERTLIVKFARERGIEPGSAADERLGTWLTERPADDVFARATRLIRAMLDEPSADRPAIGVADLLRHCEAIAAASGGVLGFGRISSEERALLAQIEAALKGR